MSITKLFIEAINFDVNEEQVGLWTVKIKEDGALRGEAELESFHEYNWDIKDIMSREEFNKHFPYGEYLSIRNMNVNTLDRGKGFGKKLMKKVISFAKKEGFKTIHLNAYAKTGRRALSQSDLIGFYKTFGFEIIKQGRKNAVMIKQLD